MRSLLVTVCRCATVCQLNGTTTYTKRKRVVIMMYYLLKLIYGVSRTNLSGFNILLLMSHSIIEILLIVENFNQTK